MNGGPETKSSEKAARDPKHVLILKGVSEIRKSISEFQEFIDYVGSGSIPAPNPEVEQATEGMPLGDVLSSLPDTLLGIADEIRKVREELRARLY